MVWKMKRATEGHFHWRGQSYGRRRQRPENNRAFEKHLQDKWWESGKDRIEKRNREQDARERLNVEDNGRDRRKEEHAQPCNCAGV